MRFTREQADNHFHAPREPLRAHHAARLVRCWAVPPRGECVPLRGAARSSAGPSLPPGGYERDYEPREPDHCEIIQAYIDAKYAGEAGDWAAIEYRLSLRPG